MREFRDKAAVVAGAAQRFYIVTNPDEWKPFIRERFEHILGDRNPGVVEIG